MSKIVVIGAGAMGTAFALPCLDNNHDINIVGTHLENDFIEKLKKNNYIKENSKLLENYENFLTRTKILKYDKKENLINLDPRVFIILFFIFLSIICLILKFLITKFKFKISKDFKHLK